MEDIKHINNYKFNAKHYKVKIVKRKTNKLKLFLSVISYAIFIWLMLIGITLLIYAADVKIRALKGDYTSPNINAYVVLTGSMIPDIKVNDIVLTKKVDPEKLQVGDVITFLSSDSRFKGLVVTHRIVEIIKDEDGSYKFRSKGDNNNTVDMAIVEDYNILGKVILKIPKLGYLQTFLATKSGWVLAILIPSLLVLSYDIMKLFKTLGKKSKLIKS